MRRKAWAWRLGSAAALGLASIASCAGAAPGDGARLPDVEPVDPIEAAKRAPGNRPSADAGLPDDGGSSGDGGPRCPYGSLEDPHRGFVRCLTPEERDAGWLPPPPQKDPAQRDPAQQDPPADDAGAAKPAAIAPAVEVGAPKFENGQVTRVEKVLGGVAGDVGKCIADHGGLTGATGSLKVQFLVRARGRAEGVEVLGVKGVSAEAGECVRKLLKNKAIGAPSADPVGVTVVFSLKAAK